MSHYFAVIIYVVTFYNAFAYHHESATIKSYEVLNADQIRLIDDGPLWNLADTVITTTRKPTTNAEHRSLKSNFKNSQQKENTFDQTSQEGSKELHEFLRSYAEKVKRKKPVTTEEPDLDSYERFHKVELISKPDEPTNRLANLLLGNKFSESIEQKSKAWGSIKKKPQVQQQEQQPHADDKKGWVSLEVMPWSVSKVAKWHSSNFKQNSESRPRPDYHVSTAHDAWNYPMPKPHITYNPPHSQTYNPPPYSSTYSPSYGSVYNPTIPNYKPKPFSYGGESYTRPFDSTPMTTPDKLYIPQEYFDDIPRPWHKQPQFPYAQYDHNNSNDEEDQDMGNGFSSIITDGLPPNFPGYRPSNNRRKGFPTETEHPLSHPFNGDGEWVLLTTTKGYKGSNGRQRSLDIDAIPEQDVDSIKSHKSVRLTVLPPLKDSKVNMTTSHGGLLQVESTFETVDEAQKLAEKKENMKKISVKTKHLKKPIKQAEVANSTVPSTVAPSAGSKFKFPVPSSVLAAVGAGMIPATMAMLVPMAMGRRRKRDVEQRDQPETLRFSLPIQLRHRL